MFRMHKPEALIYAKAEGSEPIYLFPMLRFPADPI